MKSCFMQARRELPYVVVSKTHPIQTPWKERRPNTKITAVWAANYKYWRTLTCPVLRPVLEDATLPAGAPGTLFFPDLSLGSTVLTSNDDYAISTDRVGWLFFFLAGTEIAKAEKHSPLCLPAGGADAERQCKGGAIHTPVEDRIDRWTNRQK